MISDAMTKALNEQMNFEFYSANIYLSMSAYCNHKGLDGFANWFYNQYQEEMIHAMKFYHYILDQGQQALIDACPKPQSEFGDPLQMFQITLGHEQEVTKRIYSLVDLALDERDHGTNSFLQWFVTEQVEEEATVNGIIDKVNLVEGTGNGIFMLNNELGQRQPPAAEPV